MTPRALPCALVLLVLSGGCASYGAESPIEIVTACQAAIDETVVVRGGLPEIDLAEAERRTLEECGSVEEWRGAAEARPDAVPPDVAWREWLDELCARPDHAGTAVCLDLVVGESSG